MMKHRWFSLFVVFLFSFGLFTFFILSIPNLSGAQAAPAAPGASERLAVNHPANSLPGAAQRVLGPAAPAGGEEDPTTQELLFSEAAAPGYRDSTAYQDWLHRQRRVQDAPLVAPYNRDAPLYWKPNPGSSAALLQEPVTLEPASTEIRRAPGAANAVTLGLVHLNPSTNGFSSRFVFTNTGSASADFNLQFYWPGGQFLLTRGPYPLDPGQGYTYDMRDLGYGPNHFVGNVTVESSQPAAGKILTPDYGMFSGMVFLPGGTTPATSTWLGVHLRYQHDWYGNGHTLSDGHFYLGGLPAGIYALRVDGNYPYARTWSNGAAFIQDAEPIPLGAGEQHTGLNLVLQPGGTISGVVYGPDGSTPLPNAPVDLAEGWFGACTNASGQYVIQGVPYGDWVVSSGFDWDFCSDTHSIYIQEYYPEQLRWEDAAQIPVNGTSDQVAGKDFYLQVGGVIKGRVTTNNFSQPLPGMQVAASEYDEEWYWRHGTTDASGYYTITGLVDANYRLRIDGDQITGYAQQYYSGQVAHHRADRVPISGANTQTGINFDLQPGGTISGLVVDQDTSQPIGRVPVSADSQDGDYGIGGCTNSDGTFTINGIPFGSYKIRAGGGWNWCKDQPGEYAREWYPETPNWGTAEVITIDVSNQNPTGYDFSLEIGGKITGTVTDASGPVSGLSMVLYRRLDRNGDDCPLCFWMDEVRTDDQGNYTFGGITPNEYRVYACAHCSGQLLANKFYPDVYRWMDAQSLFVEKGQTIPDITFFMDSGLLISGTINVPQGYSAEGFGVDLWDEYGVDGYQNHTRTDANGYYEFSAHPLANTLWRIEVYADGSDLANLWANELDFSTQTQWDFDLGAGGVITGQVTENGQPVANAFVTAGSPVGWQGGQTNDQGYYQITNLATGIYDVMLESEHMGYLWRIYDGSDWNQKVPVNVKAGQTVQGINLTAQQGGEIIGHVTDQATGDPLDGMRMIAYTEDGVWQTFTDESGFYSLNAPAGEVRVLANAGLTGDYVYTYSSGGWLYGNADPVVVPAWPDAATVDVAMKRRSTVTGKVTDASSGAALPRIHVAVLSNDPALGRPYARWTCTDETGHYLLEAVIPGTVELTAVGTCGHPGSYGAVTQAFTLQPNTQVSKDLALTVGTDNPPALTVRTNPDQFFSPLRSGGIGGLTVIDQILPALYEPLIQLNEQGEWYSELLTQIPTLTNGGVSTSTGRLVVTYTLKTGLLWSDGAPLTSGDIRFTWEKAHQPSAFGQPIMTQHKVESVTTPDSQTAVITFRPNQFPVDYLGAFLYLLPEHMLSGVHVTDLDAYLNYTTGLVGNGPYVIEDFVAGSHMDLRANPNYHKRAAGYPKTERVRLLFTGDPYHSLLNGSADVSLDLMPEMPPVFASADLKLYAQPGLAFFGLWPNTEMPQFQDPAVRRALFQALDRQGFADAFAPSIQVPHNWVVPGSPMYNDTFTRYAFDLDAAAAALTAAGWVDTNENGIRDKDGVEFVFELGYPLGNEKRLYLTMQFAEDLAQIGVDANVVGFYWNEFIEKAWRGQFGAFTIAFTSGGRYAPDAAYYFSSQFIPDAFNQYDLYNFGNASRYSDPTMDELVEQIAGALDHGELKQLYAEQMAYFADQLPFWPTRLEQTFHATTPTLLNFKPAPHLPATWNIEEWQLPANPYDLGVRTRLTEDSPAPQPGVVITYAVTVRNNGFFDVDNAVLVQELPDEVVYQDANTDPNLVEGSNLTWHLGNFPKGAEPKVIKVQVSIPGAVPHNTPLIHHAQVFMDQLDTYPANNAFQHEVLVRDDVDLAVQKTGVGQPMVGANYTYYLSYANWGGAPATGAVLTDTLPGALILRSTNPPADRVNGNILEWDLPTLLGNQWGGRIEVVAEINATGTLVNTAEIAYTGAETMLANNVDDHIEEAAGILAPVLTRPTSGTTNSHPTTAGQAPANAIVKIYDLSVSPPTLMATTNANGEGTFEIELTGLALGSYSLAATATKDSQTSGYSNQANIKVVDDLGLDSDFVMITANGATISAGAVRADKATLGRRAIDAAAVLPCPTQPTAHLKVIQNGKYTYLSPALTITAAGSEVWAATFQTWLADPGSNYEIWIEWDCGTGTQKELLVYLLIDPDGYLFDQTMVNAGTPVADALILDGTVTLYAWVNDGWQVWEANFYGQVNPQVTDETTPDGVLEAGYYSFLTPPGRYYITATAPGYQPFQSEVLTVVDTPIRRDIGMQPVVGGSGFTRAPANLAGSHKSANPAQSWVGDAVTIDIWLTNSGNEDTGTLTLYDPVPAYAAFIPNTLGADAGTAGFNPTDNRVEWTGVVPKGQTVQISYQLRVTGFPGAPFDLVSTAEVTGLAEDLATLPELQASTAVQGGAGVLISSASMQYGAPGTVVTYTHTVENAGNVSDTYTVTTSSSHGWTVTAGTLPPLDPGETAVLWVAVAVPADAPLELVAATTVTVTSHYDPARSAAAVDITMVGTEDYMIYLPLVSR